MPPSSACADCITHCQGPMQSSCQSLLNLFDARHVPDVETDYRAIDDFESSVLYGVCFDSFPSLVGRVVELDHGFYSEVRVTDREIYVFAADLVELPLPIGILSNSDQCRHGYLRQDDFIGHCFAQSMEEYLFGFAQRRFSEVGGRRSFFVGGISVFLGLEDEEENGRDYEQQKHCFHDLSLSGFMKPDILSGRLAIGMSAFFSPRNSGVVVPNVKEK